MERLASLKELMAIDSDRLDELEHSLTTFEVGTYDTTILRYYLPPRADSCRSARAWNALVTFQAELRLPKTVLLLHLVQRAPLDLGLSNVLLECALLVIAS